jgi:hypothetical protein
MSIPSGAAFLLRQVAPGDAAPESTQANPMTGRRAPRRGGMRCPSDPKEGGVYVTDRDNFYLMGGKLLGTSLQKEESNGP